MTLLRLCLILSTFSILTGCTTGYAPEGDYGGFPHGGYTNSPTDMNTEVVGFQGNMFTARQTAKNYMMYRSAKVTLDSGYDYFVIVSSSFTPYNISITTEDSYNGYISDPPTLYNVFSRKVNLVSYYARKTAVRFTGSNQCRIGLNGAVAVIKMFKGSIPRGLPYAYYARDILTHLGSETFGAVTY